MLQSPLLFAEIVGVLGTLLACSVALLMILRRRKLFQEVRKALDGGLLDRQSAYQRLVLSANRSMHIVTLSALALFLVSSGFIFLHLPPSSYYSKTTFMRCLGLILCLDLGPALILPHVCYDILGILLVDMPALTYFQYSPLTRKQAFYLSLKSNFLGVLPNEQHIRYGRPVSLLSLLLIEVTGILCYMEVAPPLWLLFAASLCWATCTMIFSKWIIAWKSSSQPIERTPWAPLIHHLESWGRTKGLKLQQIRVHYLTRIGVGESIVVGSLQPVLLLNQLFLSNSDWRQQEATVAILLGQLRKHMTFLYTLVNNALFVLGWGTFTWLLSMLLTQHAPSAFESTALIFLMPALAFLTPAVFTQQTFHKHVIAADQASLDLTDDPAATLVAILTTHLLTTGQTTPDPLTLQRIQTLARQLSAYPPRAALPIPEAIQEILDEQHISFPTLPKSAEGLHESPSLWPLTDKEKKALPTDQETREDYQT